MRIIVTGAAGFVASHLCEKLIELGHEVYGIDDLSTGNPTNLASIISHNKFHFFKYDITSSIRLEKLFKGQRIDWIFHLAAKADIVPSIQTPYLYHKVNVEGTVRLLELARKYEVKRFIYTASSSCYGIPDVYPTSEDALIQPEYPYALTKWVGEQYVLHYSRVYGLPVLSLRLFNVFGPRARTSGTYGAVFGVFLAQLLNDKPLTVVGDGRQSRDFTYVSDVVKALCLAAESKYSGLVFNIGTGQPQTVNHLVELLKPKMGVEFVPKRPGEPDVTCAGIKKAEAWLNFTPEVSFEEGVAKLLKEAGAFKNAPVWTKDLIHEATKDWFKYLGKGSDGQDTTRN